MNQNTPARTFASDNNSGVSPEILQALAECNHGHTIGYGADPWTQKATQTLKRMIQKECDIFFVYGGTGANVLSLSSATPSFGGILCAESAHINVDECGAPEKFSGAKLLTVPTSDGKISIPQLEKFLSLIGDQHHSQPSVVSVSQPTELGTLYTLQELKEITSWAHQNNMLVHLDGARISNGLVALGCNLEQMVSETNLDILSMGATKNGLMFGEAIVSFNQDCSKRLLFLRKQGMQLHSKMRFISAQFDCIFSTSLWEKNARQANDMSRLLKKEIEKIDQLKIVYPVETNAVFVRMPKNLIKPLQAKHFFYVWNSQAGIVRWMTSFDTQRADVLGFVEDIRNLLSTHSPTAQEPVTG